MTGIGKQSFDYHRQKHEHGKVAIPGINHWENQAAIRSALGLSGFSAALENWTDQSPRNETYTVAQSASVSKIPRLHNHYVRSDFRNAYSLRPSSCNLVRLPGCGWMPCARRPCGLSGSRLQKRRAMISRMRNSLKRH